MNMPLQTETGGGGGRGGVRQHGITRCSQGRQTGLGGRTTGVSDACTPPLTGRSRQRGLSEVLRDFAVHVQSAGVASALRSLERVHAQTSTT